MDKESEPGNGYGRAEKTRCIKDFIERQIGLIFEDGGYDINVDDNGNDIYDIYSNGSSQFCCVLNEFEPLSVTAESTGFGQGRLHIMENAEGNTFCVWVLHYAHIRGVNYKDE